MQKTTCPLDCFDGCSMSLEADGRLKGDKSHPITQGYLCHHLNHYHTWERITQPRFHGRDISMQEALTILEKNFQTYAPSKTLFFKGSGNLGVMQSVTKRFFAAHKSVIASGSLCDEAGDAGIVEGRGANLALSPLHVKHSDVVILWGRNPSVTNSHMLPSLKGKTLIVIDPIKTDLALNAALHLQITPAGDLYLALLLCRILHMEGLEDKAFIQERTENFDAFLKLIYGLPMRTLMDKTGLKLDDLALLLSLIKDKKLSILVGIGVQKYSFGHSVLRAIDALAAMLGLFGKEGCGVGYLSNSGFGFSTPFKLKTKTEHLPICDFSKYDTVFIQGGNPLAQMPCTPKVEERLAKVACVVYFGLHENETSAKAHLVIPALSFLEKEDVKLSYGHEFIGRMPKLIDNTHGISEYALTQHLLKVFGYEGLEDEQVILDAIIASHSVEKEGFLISKTYETLPYEKSFYTPSGLFEFLDEFEDTFDDQGDFYLLAAKQNKGLNSQFIKDDYLYVPLSLGLKQDERVLLSSPYGTCEYPVMPTEKLREDCLLLYSGARNANRLTPLKISQEGECAIYQEVKVTLEKLS
jgi:anaerobic selenocysteine-containing dehydrogenase